MATAASFDISTTVPPAEQARRITADVDRYGAVVLVGRRAQARQLRRVLAALRADGLQTHYFSDNAAGRHLLTVEPPGPTVRALSWWGCQASRASG
jgi:hypothetical protein